MRVDMGPPDLRARGDPGHAGTGPDALARQDRARRTETLEAACLSMGNPHAVLFVDDPDESTVSALGPRIEKHAMFPNGTNVEFVKRREPDHVRMRVWERGSGETLACGTGAAAVAVAARAARRRRRERDGRVCPAASSRSNGPARSTTNESVFMTGPAVEVVLRRVRHRGTRVRTAKRIEKLPPYLFAEIDRKVAEAKARGADIISFGVGDPDLPTPPHIVEALAEAPRDPGTHRYPVVHGHARVPRSRSRRGTSSGSA